MSRIILALIQWLLFLGLGLLGIGLRFNNGRALMIGLLLLGFLPMLCFLSLFFRD